MIERTKVSEPVKLTAYREVIEYLASRVAPEDVLAFKVSEAMQERIEDLLDRNNEGQLSAAEKRELDDIADFNRLMVVVFARAAAAQKQSQ